MNHSLLSIRRHALQAEVLRCKGLGKREEINDGTGDSSVFMFQGLQPSIERVKHQQTQTGE